MRNASRWFSMLWFWYAKKTELPGMSEDTSCAFSWSERYVCDTAIEWMPRELVSVVRCLNLSACFGLMPARNHPAHQPASSLVALRIRAKPGGVRKRDSPKFHDPVPTLYHYRRASNCSSRLYAVTFIYK